MLEFNNGEGAIKYASVETSNKIISKIFIWMFIGLLISALSGYGTLILFANNVVSTSVLWISMILELVVVILLTSRISKMSSTAAKFWFVVYSIISGVSLTPIFVVYDIGLLSYAFICSAGMFGAMAIIGSVIKTDLTNFGSVGLMLLVGILITTLGNMFFFHSTGLELILLYAGLAVFAGLTMYDMQKFKMLAKDAEMSGDPSMINKVVIIGALELYLDFINIFLRIIRLLGRNNRD